VTNAPEVPMAMRETVGSLRLYLILAGLCICVPSLATLATRPMSLDSVIAFAATALGLAYLFLGVRLKALLVSAPALVTAVLIASGAVAAVALLVSLLFGSTSGAIEGAIGMLIAWYLYANARRLSSDTIAVAPPRPDSRT
jgi:hypothetical protein